jgi:hypothetical protein
MDLQRLLTLPGPHLGTLGGKKYMRETRVEKTGCTLILITYV